MKLTEKQPEKNPRKSRELPKKFLGVFFARWGVFTTISRLFLGSLRCKILQHEKSCFLAPTAKHVCLNWPAQFLWQTTKVSPIVERVESQRCLSNSRWGSRGRPHNATVKLWHCYMANLKGWLHAWSMHAGKERNIHVRIYAWSNDENKCFSAWNKRKLRSRHQSTGQWPWNLFPAGPRKQIWKKTTTDFERNS